MVAGKDPEAHEEVGDDGADDDGDEFGGIAPEGDIEDEGL